MKISFLAAALVSVSALAGCAAGPSAEGSAQQTVVVTAQDTQGLSGSQKLEEKLGPGVEYRFDASAGPIDFGRIELVTRESTHVPMAEIVADMAQAEGVTAESFARRSFTIAGDAVDPGAQGGAKDQSGAPEAAPQLASTCTFWVTYYGSDGKWHSIPFPC